MKFPELFSDIVLKEEGVFGGDNDDNFDQRGNIGGREGRGIHPQCRMINVRSMRVGRLVVFR